MEQRPAGRTPMTVLAGVGGSGGKRGFLGCRTGAGGPSRRPILQSAWGVGE